MSTIINNNAITKMYKGDTPIYSFSINSGGDINLTNIDITVNGTYTAPDGEGYKTINVDVPTGGGTAKIDVAATGIKFGNSTFTEIPDVFDFSEVSDYSQMFSNNSNIASVKVDLSKGWNYSESFSNCLNLKEIDKSIELATPTEVSYMFNYCTELIEAPLINLSNVSYVYNLFSYCTNLTTIPQFDFSNVSYIGYLFSYCNNLTTIPQFDFSNVQVLDSVFLGCSSLTSIPDLITSKVYNMSSCFGSCHSLTSLPKLDCSSVYEGSSPIGWDDLYNLTELGGFENLKVNWEYDFLEKTPNLTVESLMNVINNLFDWTDYPDGRVPNEYGEWDYGTEHRLMFGQTNLDKLTSGQIEVAIAKGWTLLA